ncbi:hypothetical protein QCM77_07165 [Bradyrhizobium sp. SSUT18]|uniref:hypothetical protein n=1 Tax=unclassified Bradyrhizobium TaxID=2631580 RepID=UPI0024488988|nr:MULTISPECIES: hypothetical protein [unclassified Bradyrhizobium]MDH2350187.1 hypothetical protein [Bradyrhizobium sp. SSUT112]MDH2399725.1 hypothetical protein [Bradyrhizobium sp. SSUT18]
MKFGHGANFVSRIRAWHCDETWRLNMTNGQDTNSKGQAEPGESLKDGAPNKTSTPGKDALSDSSLDDVSGGSTWRPFSTTGKGG